MVRGMKKILGIADPTEMPKHLRNESAIDVFFEADLSGKMLVPLRAKQKVIVLQERLPAVQLFIHEGRDALKDFLYDHKDEVVLLLDASNGKSTDTVMVALCTDGGKQVSEWAAVAAPKGCLTVRNRRGVFFLTKFKNIVETTI